MARAMKDSGVEWIGEIPKTWYVARVKTIFKERTELSETGNELLLSVSEYYGIASRASKIGEGEYVTRAASLVGYKKCYKGDLVSNIMLAWKGSLGVSDIDGIVSPAYCVYQPQGDVCPRFFHYLFRTKLYTDRFKLFSRGIIDSRLRLYSPFFYDIEAIIPPRIEQQRIADFLDTQTADIDASIAKTQESIEEYKKLKQAVITQAVTKGIRPDRAMKDSGVEWIGDIPEGWSIKKSKFFADFINGFAFSSDSFINEGKCYVVRISDIADGKIRYDSCVRVNKTDGMQSFRIIENDILLAMSGATVGKVGMVSDAQVEAYANQRVGIIRCNYPKYLFYCLQTHGFKEYVLISSSGTAQPNVSAESFGKFEIPYPSTQEQQEIATYLDEKCAAIDTLIEKKQAIITELEAYKKSLIYEYVTGKKEVPMASC